MPVIRTRARTLWLILLIAVLAGGGCAGKRDALTTLSELRKASDFHAKRGAELRLILATQMIDQQKKAMLEKLDRIHLEKKLEIYEKTEERVGTITTSNLRSLDTALEAPLKRLNEQLAQARSAGDKETELSVRYDLMVSLMGFARDENSLETAREALEICSSIVRKDITYRDIRVCRKQAGELIKELSGPASSED